MTPEPIDERRLRGLVTEYADERDALDFKRELYPKSKNAELARDIMAFGNLLAEDQEGFIIVGVASDGVLSASVHESRAPRGDNRMPCPEFEEAGSWHRADVRGCRAI